jgi:hypothetical protein
MMLHVVDPAELSQWLAEGRPYWWMVSYYETEYGLHTSVSQWATYVRRENLTKATAGDQGLLVWEILQEHRWSIPARMLGIEARRRAGLFVDPREQTRLDSWLRTLREGDLVVHYDPTTEEGWSLLPRRDGVDLDLIRVPDTS